MATLFGILDYDSTIPARDISLYELEEKFGLQLATDTNFLPEWTENLATLPSGLSLTYTCNSNPGNISSPERIVGI